MCKGPVEPPTLPVPRGWLCSSLLLGLTVPHFLLHAKSLNCLLKLLYMPQGHETSIPQICTLLPPGLALGWARGYTADQVGAGPRPWGSEPVEEVKMDVQLRAGLQPSWEGD